MQGSQLSTSRYEPADAAGVFGETGFTRDFCSETGARRYLSSTSSCTLSLGRAQLICLSRPQILKIIFGRSTV